MRTLALLCCTAFVCQMSSQLVWAGEIYRWVDEKGRVHYSDQAGDKSAKAIGSELKSVNISDGQPVQVYGEVRPKTSAELEIEQREQVAARKREASWQQKCEQAKQQLKTIAGPVVFTREDGSTFEISEQERANKEQKLRRSYERHCG